MAEKTGFPAHKDPVSKPLLLNYPKQHCAGNRQNIEKPPREAAPTPLEKISKPFCETTDGNILASSQKDEVFATCALGMAR
jgi:hypothetical protein